VRIKTGLITIFISVLLMPFLAAQTLLDRGIVSFNIGDYEDAIASLENYLVSEPGSEQAYEYLVNSYLAMKMTDNALATLEKAAQIIPDEPQYYWLMGQLHASHQRFEKSYADLERYFKMSPGDPAARELLKNVSYNCGIESAQKKKYQKALDYLGKAIELDSLYVEAYQNKAAVLIELKDYQAAARHLESSLSKFPDNIVFRKAYFDVLVKQEKYREALPVLEEIKLAEPGNIDLALQLGLLYRHLNEVDKAMSLYHELINKNPRERKIYEAVIDYWSNFGRQEKIRETYELMLEAFPNDRGILINIAATYESENKWQEARDVYYELVNADSLDTDIRLRIASTYTEESEAELKIAELVKILEYDPESYPALKELGLVYDGNDQILDSFKIYEKMKDAYPEEYYANYHFGLALYQNDKLQAAKEYLDLARNYEPEKSSPYYILGLIAVKSEHKEKAIDHYRQALNLAIKNMSNFQQQIKTEFQAEGGNLRLDKLNQYRSHELKIKEIEFIIERCMEYLNLSYAPDEFGEMLNTYLRRYPTSVFLHLYQARWYRKQAEPKQAIASYEKAIALNPKIRQPHEELAILYEDLKEYTNAETCYRRIIAIDSNDETGYSGLIRVSSKQEKLGLLCDQWLAKHKLYPKHEILKERLIEILHKTGRFVEARALVESDNDEKSTNE